MNSPTVSLRLFRPHRSKGKSWLSSYLAKPLPIFQLILQYEFSEVPEEAKDTDCVFNVGDNLWQATAKIQF